MKQKNPQKQGRILEGGGRIFLAGQNINSCGKCNFPFLAFIYRVFIKYFVFFWWFKKKHIPETGSSSSICVHAGLPTRIARWQVAHNQNWQSYNILKKSHNILWTLYIVYLSRWTGLCPRRSWRPQSRSPRCRQGRPWPWIRRHPSPCQPGHVRQPDGKYKYKNLFVFSKM